MKKILIIMFLSTLFVSCMESNVNNDKSGSDKFEAKEIEYIPNNQRMWDTTYVAIYSDIYTESRDIKFNLTATLSLRNTSQRHNIYISDVNYFNSSGKLVKEFLNKPILLEPLQSIEYVIEKNNETGGTGANFIINWSSPSVKAKPIIEAVMISTSGQQGISFKTKGVSISEH